MISKLVISQAAIYDIEQAIDWYNRQRKGLGDELEISLEVGLASNDLVWIVRGRIGF